MDRLGIECYFQNKTGSHDFNIIKLDGNYYGIDVTWDNCYGKDTNICEFKQFGRDLSFYSSVYHRKGVFVSDSLYDEIQNGNIKIEEWTQDYLNWEFDLDYTKIDGANLLLGTAQRYIYPNFIEMEFMKGLVKKDINDIMRKRK